MEKPLQVGMVNPPRLDDVAQRAGVSSATVSRVLNQPGKVTEALRSRVQRAVEELGYVPHGAARALASRRSKTVGAIVPTIDNAIFAASLQHLQDKLSSSGYTLLLASSNYDLDHERKECQALVEKNIDGLILVGESHHPSVYRMLISKGVPYVNIWIYDEDSEHPCVGFDNYQSAQHITNYLLDIGHREIGMIAGINHGNDRATARSAGVRDCLEQRGFPFRDGRYLEMRYEVSEGRVATRKMLATESPPTAIICGNDILALGAMFECQKQGYKVPTDMSITGYDGLDIAAQVSPGITTVHIPAKDMGHTAAEYIMGRLEDENVVEKTLLQANLVIRESTAPPRGH